MSSNDMQKRKTTEALEDRDPKRAAWDALSGLAKSPEFQSFDIHCGSRVFKVNSLVMNAHSPFFKRACLGSFKEGKERKVTLVDDGLRAMTAMIEFFHTLGYEVDTNDENPLLVHAAVFSLADKYEISALMATAVSKFHNQEFGNGHLKHFSYCVQLQKKIELLLEITPEAYSAAPRDDRLREEVLALWCGCVLEKDASPAMAVTPNDLQRLMSLVPAFASDLITKLSDSDHMQGTQFKSLAAKRMFKWILRDCYVDEVVHASDVTENLDLSLDEVRTGAKEIIAAGHMELEGDFDLEDDATKDEDFIIWPKPAFWKKYR